MLDAPSQGPTPTDASATSGPAVVGEGEVRAVEPAGTPAGTCPPQLAATRWQPGQSGNPAGSSKALRFKAAVLRALRKRMGPNDQNELDVAAERLVDLVMTKDNAATRLLVELWAREDGPVEQRIASAGGEPLQIVMELHDTRLQAEP